MSGQRPDGLPTIGLAIIARDEEKHLPRLLDSVGFTEPDEPFDDEAWRPEAAVDFVVVCDTGSEDGTPDLARRRGCRVVEFAWCDDFAAARSASFDALPDGIDFTLWADCDDAIDGAGELRALAANVPPEIAGLIQRYNYAQDEAGNCICELWRERLVRRAAYGGWDLPVHEIQRVNGPLMHSDSVTWVHHMAERERVPERNYRILRRDYEQGDPPSTRTLAYLGTECLALGRFDEAADLFREYLGRSDNPGGEEECQVAHKLSTALRQGDDADLEESERWGLYAINRRPDWPDGYLDLAELALRREQWQHAIYCAETAMRLDAPRTMLIINPLEYAYQPKLMRSVALSHLGRYEEALADTEEVLAVTPHREDLARQAGGLRAQLAVAEAEKHFLALREILVRHDENEKARRLMDAAPYFIEYRPLVHSARLDQREMTLHADDPEIYRSYYRDNPGEAPFEVHGIEISAAHEHFHRLGFVRELLKDENLADLRLLDLSANDGWMAANLSDYGIGRVDMMDLNPDSCERAWGRRESYPGMGEVVCADLQTAPEHYEAGSYDAVICFETIEHVPDPAAMIGVMCRMAKPGGRILISTPDGAYERGVLPGWARVESKGHLRAIPLSDLAAMVCPVGMIEAMESQQRVGVTSVRVAPRAGRIAILAGGAEATPEALIEQGLGGSETALVKMAEQFAQRSFDVRVYAGQGGGVRSDAFTTGREPIAGQVLYEPQTAWDPGEPADLFVSLRIPEAFDRTIAAPRRALWLHDADYGDRLTPERVERATDVLVLSDFQRGLLVGKYPFLDDPERLWVTRNGIEPAFFKRLARKHKPWVVYSSSPDRGLDVLLEVWPEIRRRVPAAELHHTYAPVYHRFREIYPHLAEFHARIEALSADAEGVVGHGSMGQQELAKLYGRAMVWGYPSWTTPLLNEPFPEISCISAVEAQAARCVPICLDHGALRESVVGGERIPAELGPDGSLSAAWRERFVDAICGVLSGGYAEREGEIASGRAWALERGWSGVADAWVERFDLAAVPEPGWTKIKA